jgi:phosphatidylinositol-4,5-bisphosphate 3-kinase
VARRIQPRFSLILSEGLLNVQLDEFIRPVHALQGGVDPKWLINDDPFMLSRGTVDKETNAYLSTWHVRQTYKLKVLSANNCNINESMKVYVRAGLCHGDQTLCPTISTVKGANYDKPEWNEVLEFDVPITELPRSTKLCFVIYQQRQPGRKRKEDAPLAWVNFNVFDYNGTLQAGNYCLYAWPIEDDHALQDQLNYIGSTVNNSKNAKAIQLTVDIPPFVGQGSIPVMFPSSGEVYNFANEMAQGATAAVRQFVSYCVISYVL